MTNKIEYEFTHVLLKQGKAIANLNFDNNEDAALIARAIVDLTISKAPASAPLTDADFRLKPRPMKSAKSNVRTKPSK